MKLLASVLVSTLVAVPAHARADAGGDDGEGGVELGEIVNRIGVHAQLGDGWNARYTGGGRARRAVSGGVGADLVAGVDNFGVVLGAGILYDQGTSPDATMPDDKLWWVDLGGGIEAAPYAPIKTPTFELRLHLGARGSMLVRRGCDAGRCGPKLEPDSGFALVFTTGVIAWWGKHRSNGLAVDAVFMRGQLGDLMPHESDPVTAAELRPPVFMLRATYMLFRGHHDQKKQPTATTPATPMTEPTPLNGPRIPTR
jgi:hypothetical protein